MTGAPAKSASNLTIRLATAAVCVPLLLYVLYKCNPLIFAGIVLVANVIGAIELFGMTHQDDRVGKWMGVVMTALVTCATYVAIHDRRDLWLSAILAVVPLAGPLLTLIHLGDIKTAAFRAFALGMGPLFLGVPLTLLANIQDWFPHGPSFVVLAMMYGWWGDTGGYFAGRFLGKHKLYEAVSPKKTVEGAVGGLFGSALGAICAHFWYMPSLPLGFGIGLAIVAGALGQAGDLAESLIKRSVGVKDSGAIIPGHGGILDRVDALLVTSTVLFLALRFFPTQLGIIGTD